MKILKLKIKNFLSIADVEVEPGKVNQIVGNNNNGKTSILRALSFAFKGSSDTSLIKTGQDSAEVMLELENDVHIQRKLNARGNQNVAVTNSTGFKADKPQTLLDSFADNFSFNPLEVLDKKKRNEFFLKVLNVKITKAELAEKIGVTEKELPDFYDYNKNALLVIDDMKDSFYSMRAEANRHYKQKKDQHEALLKVIPKKSSIDETLLKNQFNFIEDEERKLKQCEFEREMFVKDHRVAVANVEKSRLQYSDLIRQKELLNGEIKTIELQLADKKNKLKVIESSQAAITESVGLEKKKIDEMQDQINHFSFIEQDKLKLVNERNRLEQSRKELDANIQIDNQLSFAKELADDVGIAQQRADELDRIVTALQKNVKQEIMAKANIPIKGLAYENGQFTLDGFALDTLSSSKTLRVALALVKSLASEYNRIICIDGIELLDAQTYAELREEIENDDFVYFITKVGDALNPVMENDKVIHMEKGEATV